MERGATTASSRSNELTGVTATAGAGTCGWCDAVSDCGPGVPLVGSPHTVWQQIMDTGEAADDFACAQQAISAGLSWSPLPHAKPPARVWLAKTRTIKNAARRINIPCVNYTRTIVLSRAIPLSVSCYPPARRVLMVEHQDYKLCSRVRCQAEKLKLDSDGSQQSRSNCI